MSSSGKVVNSGTFRERAANLLAQTQNKLNNSNYSSNVS